MENFEVHLDLWYKPDASRKTNTELFLNIIFCIMDWHVYA